jgi:hypothetical protein
MQTISKVQVRGSRSPAKFAVQFPDRLCRCKIPPWNPQIRPHPLQNHPEIATFRRAVVKSGSAVVKFTRKSSRAADNRQILPRAAASSGGNFHGLCPAFGAVVAQRGRGWIRRLWLELDKCAMNLTMTGTNLINLRVNLTISL